MKLGVNQLVEKSQATNKKENDKRSRVPHSTLRPATEENQNEAGEAESASIRVERCGDDRKQTNGKDRRDVQKQQQKGEGENRRQRQIGRQIEREGKRELHLPPVSQMWRAFRKSKEPKAQRRIG